MKILLYIAAYCVNFCLFAQSPPWQQRASYVMQVRLDPATHLLRGTQQLTYHNASPDTLRRVYYHLYFNAFQPKSMMDVRSRTIVDADHRVTDRIFNLQPKEIGYQKVRSLTQSGKQLDIRTEGTILVATLQRPLLPNKKTVLEMDFEAQVPLQIRRTGRNNKEGIAYSMSQWYPKLAEYDQYGWHATPYVGREFHGTWGDFDVTIEIDSAFVLAATGVLKNPSKIGKGYSKSPAAGNARQESRLKWHFVAKNVHDFVWAADKNYIHDVVNVEKGPVLHFFYVKKVQPTWLKMQPYIAKAFLFLNQIGGTYPYPHYSIIQGGDGGMEYPMATLITGNRSLRSLLGVTVHEIAHSWYQGLLATDESMHAWMDEGFTTYAAETTLQFLLNEEEKRLNPIPDEYKSYKYIVKQGTEEPMNTLADHFTTNTAYGVASYAKGSIFQHQLSYIIGKKTFKKGMLRYFNEWKYRHPSPVDYIRVMEKTSGIMLHWYYNYFANTTHLIDYGIMQVDSLKAERSRIVLARLGEMPMPIELLIRHRDGSQKSYYIPIRMMWGVKEKEHNMARKVMSAWPWSHPYYSFELPVPISEIAHIEIDPSGRIADTNLDNQKVSLLSDTSAHVIKTPFEHITFRGHFLYED